MSGTERLLSNVGDYNDFSCKEQEALDKYIYNSLLNPNSYNNKNIKKYLEEHLRFNHTYGINILDEINKRILNLLALRVSRNKKLHSEYVYPVIAIPYSDYIKRLKQFECPAYYSYYHIDWYALKILLNPQYFYDKDSTSENIILNAYIKNEYKEMSNERKLYELLKKIIPERLSKEEITNIYKILSWEQFHNEPFTNLVESPSEVDIKRYNPLYNTIHRNRKETLFYLKRRLNKFDNKGQIDYIIWLAFRYLNCDIEEKNTQEIVTKYNLKREKLIMNYDFDFYFKKYNLFNINSLKEDYILELFNLAIITISEKQSTYNTNKELINKLKYNDYINLAFRDILDDKTDVLFKTTTKNIDEGNIFDVFKGIDFNNILSVDFWNEYTHCYEGVFNNDNIKYNKRSLEENLIYRNNLITGNLRGIFCTNVQPLIDSKNDCVLTGEAKEVYDSMSSLFNQIIRRTIRKTSIDEIVELMKNNEYKNVLLELIPLFEKDIENTRIRLEIDYQYNGLNSVIYNGAIKTLADEQDKYSIIKEKINSKQYCLKVNDEETINK